MIEAMSGVESISGQVDVEVTGIVYDSRRLQDGDVFVALRGENFDGAAYIGDALERGASAIVAEGPLRPEAMDVQTPYVGVTDARAALAHLSSAFYGHPSKAMEVVGITGTNGKTTTAHLLRAAFSAFGKKTGMVGTISYHVGDESLPAPFTTPEAPEFQGLLARMLEAGCTHVASEVSSHALAQRRTDSTRFSAAVFTNLTGEHLDFHHTMDEYFRAKSRLFLDLLDGPAIINMDDPYGRELARMCEGRVITYAIGQEADIVARDIKSGRDGLRFSVIFEGKTHEVSSSMLGRPNVWNVLAAAGACVSLGFDMGESLSAISKADAVNGRFMKVEEGQKFLCIIDFAHTADALRRLIESAREFTSEGGRVITVFGCGGNRDRSKRSVMGAAATELSDLVFITSDNPRGEKPEAIIEDIVRGAVKENYLVVPERSQAIHAALAEAGPADTVLIAGKGHEDYQETSGVRTSFSDIEVAREAIHTLEKGN